MSCGSMLVACLARLVGLVWLYDDGGGGGGSAIDVQQSSSKDITLTDFI